MRVCFTDVTFIPVISEAPQDIGPMDYRGMTIPREDPFYWRCSCSPSLPTPEIVPVISPVSVPKTTLPKRSNNTGVAVSAYVRTPEAS